MSMPGWVSALIGALGGAQSSGGGGGGGGGGTGSFNASGTSYWQGGPTWVGEEGPELVTLPRGTRIYSNDESMAMAGGVTVNISVASLASDLDVERLANQVARVIQRRQR